MTVLTTHQPWKRRMVNDYTYDEEEDDLEETAVRRPSGPRFGPFVTIAVAILLLFGAASRIGKPAENGNWLSIDLIASRNLAQERLRLQEQRNTTLVTLGVVPVAPERLRPQPVGVRMDSQALPPPRGDVDYHQYRQTQSIPLSMASSTQARGGRQEGGAEVAPTAAPAQKPVSRVSGAASGAAKSYTVAEGDNWVKIGKITGKKWQSILKANPHAEEGLVVGMKIVIPQ